MEKQKEFKGENPDIREGKMPRRKARKRKVKRRKPAKRKARKRPVKKRGRTSSRRIRRS